MSKRLISRRVVLTAIGVTPAALAAGNVAQAQGIGQLTDYELTPSDDSTLDTIITEKAVPYAEAHGIRFWTIWPFDDRRKYKKIAGALWVFFNRGLLFHNKAAKTTIKAKANLLTQLFVTDKTWTGRALLNNLGEFEGDFALGTLELETAICAFQCGSLAAQEAHAKRALEVGLTEYETAWEEVSNWTQQVRARTPAPFRAGGC